MTDYRNQHNAQRNWSSRQTGGDSAPANSRHVKNALSPTLETDDLTSIDSSSGRRSEESDRVGSIPSGGNTGMRGHSAISVGSTNSNYTPNVSLASGNCDNVQPNHNQVPLYETVDNIDELQHDPRNPFNTSNSLRAGWGDNIPEEDETSISTVDDSSVAPSVQSNHYQNQHSRSNSQHNLPQHRSHRHRQKQQPSVSDLDDSSTASHPSRQDFNRKTAMNDNSAHIISQLESQVAKINFELATTKSSLDELQLENRRLNDNKDKLETNITLLQDENEQLHLKNERLEREQILRNMKGTKGVARSSIDQDSCIVWGGATVSGNTWSGNGGSSVAPSNRAFVPVSKQRLGNKVEGDLAVPFPTSERDYHLRPKRFSQSSVASFNELSADGDGASRGSREMDYSAHSIALSDGSNHLDSFQLSDTGEQEQTDQRISLNLFNMIGGGNRPSVRETTKKLEEAAISLLPRRNGETEKEAEITTQSLPSDQQQNNLETSEADENDIGSNPQGEDSNDDDPFSTWSAPGDPKRKQPAQNWLQRGLGGRGRDSKNSRQPPRNEIIEDPFDSLHDDLDNDKFGKFDDAEKYTSFADNTSIISGSNGKNGDSAAETQDRNRFGLFKGLIGGGRRR